MAILRAAVVRPLSTADYPTPAQLPSYSLLDCTGSRLALALDAVHCIAYFGIHHKLPTAIPRHGRIQGPATKIEKGIGAVSAAATLPMPFN